MSMTISHYQILTRNSEYDTYALAFPGWGKKKTLGMVSNLDVYFDSLTLVCH